jgi:hypothetical protein
MVAWARGHGDKGGKGGILVARPRWWVERQRQQEALDTKMVWLGV